MLIGRWYVLDCQEWAKQPLEHGGRTEEAGMDVKRGWIGRKGERGEAGEEWSSVVIASSSALWVDRVMWVSCWVTVGQHASTINNISAFDQWRAHLLTRWSVATTVAMPLKLFSGSLCQMIPALHWQCNFASHDTVTAPEPLLLPSPRTREQWTMSVSDSVSYRRPFNRRHIFQQAGVSGKYYVGASALSALSAGCKYCQVSGGIMLISSSTACKRPQVFLSFRKLKSNIKDWP